MPDAGLGTIRRWLRDHGARRMAWIWVGRCAGRSAGELEGKDGMTASMEIRRLPFRITGNGDHDWKRHNNALYRNGLGAIA